MNSTSTTADQVGLLMNAGNVDFDSSCWIKVHSHQTQTHKRQCIKHQTFGEHIEHLLFAAACVVITISGLHIEIFKKKSDVKSVVLEYDSCISYIANEVISHNAKRRLQQQLAYMACAQRIRTVCWHRHGKRNYVEPICVLSIGYY